MLELLEQAAALWVIIAACTYVFFVFVALANPGSVNGGEWWEMVFGPAIVAAALVVLCYAFVAAMWLVEWAVQVLSS